MKQILTRIDPPVTPIHKQHSITRDVFFSGLWWCLSRDLICVRIKKPFPLGIFFTTTLTAQGFMVASRPFAPPFFELGAGKMANNIVMMRRIEVKRTTAR